MADASAELALALLIQRAIERAGFMLVAGIVVFLYDWILTFSDEVHVIWRSRPSAVRTLFVMNRYTTLTISIVALWVCQRLTLAVAVFMDLNFYLWSWIMTIRLHGLYGLRPRMKYFLATAWLCSAISSTFLCVQQTILLSRSVIVVPELRACVSTVLPPRYFTVWIPAALYKTMLFAMAMYKLLFDVHSASTSLKTLLLRDGIFHYIALTSMHLINLGLFVRADAQTTFFVVWLSLGFGSTLVSRMVLHLRLWNRIQDTPACDDWGQQTRPLAAAGRGKGSVPLMVTQQSEMTGIFELITQQTMTSIVIPDKSLPMVASSTGIGSPALSLSTARKSQPTLKQITELGLV